MAKAKKQQENQLEEVKVKFIKSPTGMFKLAYIPGEIATFEKKQADELIEMGYAEITN